MKKAMMVLLIGGITAWAYAQRDSGFDFLQWQAQEEANEIARKQLAQQAKQFACQECVQRQVSLGLDLQTAYLYCRDCP